MRFDTLLTGNAKILNSCGNVISRMSPDLFLPFSCLSWSLKTETAFDIFYVSQSSISSTAITSLWRVTSKGQIHFRRLGPLCFLPVWSGLLLFLMAALFKKATKHIKTKVREILMTLRFLSLCSSQQSK